MSFYSLSKLTFTAPYFSVKTAETLERNLERLAFASASRVKRLSLVWGF
jgi:hypothetical protein